MEGMADTNLAKGPNKKKLGTPSYHIQNTHTEQNQESIEKFNVTCKLTDNKKTCNYRN